LAYSETQVLEGSNLTSKVTRLVGKLQSRGVDCKAKLQAAWKMDRLFLQEELLAWYKPAGKSELSARWTSMV
jgi:hypothetical protein